jgi:phosphopantetheinyl transferase
MALGCDLETIEPRSDAFIADYFTIEEQELVARTSLVDQPRILALLWSGKESALKALGVGLRLDTRCVIVNPLDAQSQRVEGQSPEGLAFAFPPSYGLNAWCPMQVRYGSAQLHGWWQYAGIFLRTLVAAPPPNPPVLFETSI